MPLSLREFTLNVQKEKEKLLFHLCFMDFPVNPLLLRAEYSARGAVYDRAEELQAQLHSRTNAVAAALPFTSIVRCHVSDPQQCGQPPLSFHRAVTALFDCPMLLDNPRIVAELPADVVARARKYLAAIGPATGAYTDSTGFPFARHEIANAIDDRDGVPRGTTDIGDVYLSEGATGGARLVLTTALAGPQDAVFVPNPVSPLYSSQIAMLGATVVAYELDAGCGWRVNVDALAAQFDDAITRLGATPRVFVVVNPGSPTGHVHDRAEMEAIVRFCCNRGMLLLADEVYQDTIYNNNRTSIFATAGSATKGGLGVGSDQGQRTDASAAAAMCTFTSFHSVVMALGETVAKETMLVSLHSVSKTLGEGGRRSGYFHGVNLAQNMKDMLLKMCNFLCPNVNGQFYTALLMQPPQPGDASYEQYAREVDAINALRRLRAELLVSELAAIPNVACSRVQAGFSVLPRVTLPPAYVVQCAARNEVEQRAVPIDVRWCLELLEETGIAVTPGSAFTALVDAAVSTAAATATATAAAAFRAVVREPDGGATVAFRVTILPQPSELEHVVRELRRFVALTTSGAEKK